VQLFLSWKPPWEVADHEGLQRALPRFLKLAEILTIKLAVEQAGIPKLELCGARQSFLDAEHVL
jgi:hypothetical protein